MERALSDAIALAAVAHGGELDKSGHPYITHPIRVMFLCERYGLLAQMAAVLHDVVENTWVTLELLATMGFPAEVVEAVTHLKSLGYRVALDDFVLTDGEADIHPIPISSTDLWSKDELAECHYLVGLDIGGRLASFRHEPEAAGQNLHTA